MTVRFNKKIYNKNVSYIFENEIANKKFVRSKFSNKEINQSIFYVPVVDENKKVKNILTTERIVELMENKNFRQKKKKIAKVLIVGGAGYIEAFMQKLLKNYTVKIVDKVLYDKNVISNFIKIKIFI